MSVDGVVEAPSGDEPFGADAFLRGPKRTDRHERDIVVHGSPQLAKSLLEPDLVGERLLVYRPAV